MQSFPLCTLLQPHFRREPSLSHTRFSCQKLSCLLCKIVSQENRTACFAFSCALEGRMTWHDSMPLVSCAVQHPPSYVLVENVVGFDKSPMRTQLHDTLALVGLSMQVISHLSRSRGHLCHQAPIASAALHKSVISFCLIRGVASVAPSEHKGLIKRS